MSIKIEVTGESIVELADKLWALATQFQPAPAAKPVLDPVMPEVAEAAKPKAKKKADPKVEAAEEADAPFSSAGQTEASQPTEEKASASSPTEASGAPSETTLPASASELDFEKDVGPIVVEAVTSKGREAVVGVLSQFGAERASEVPEAQWAELVEALKAL